MVSSLLFSNTADPFVISVSVSVGSVVVSISIEEERSVSSSVEDELSVSNVVGDELSVINVVEKVKSANVEEDEASVVVLADSVSQNVVESVEEEVVLGVFKRQVDVSIFDKEEVHSGFSTEVQT